jgi:hypothetical protein
MSEFNIYNVFLPTKHTYNNKTQSWLEQRLVEYVRQKGKKSGAKWDSVNITGLHQISRENTPSVKLRLKKKRLIQQRMAVGISKKKTIFFSLTEHSARTKHVLPPARVERKRALSPPTIP